MKTQNIIRAEESLRDFILQEFRIESMRTKDKKLSEYIMMDAYKYRNLTITVNTGGRDAIPQFSVQIAASEAIFGIDTGKKIDGGMPFNDVKLIESWLGNSANKTLMKDIWTGSYQEKYIKLRPFDSF